MSETYQTNLKRLTDLAQQHGLVLNPNEERVKKVVDLMADNFDMAGEWVCPCKQTVKPAVKGKDTTCPCPEWQDEINAQGHCHCKLFYTKEKATQQQNG